ncbi:LD-carboxypeptidase [Segetibacter sp. 3557_3]|uniref:S66 peptidase family protein n=1 Tax=Segetibacter sp. 3557_3 TaxID=2547429 RepID=UPI001058CB47|nr:LD-carboxypeptidase [Segetibacter sp. 3557_3]TDH26228.1 LD-carboxypeptidase [Segetibacter sp. 3557_3]
MAIIPPFLQAGSCIGVLCPAGFMPLDKAQTCLDVLQQWGYRVKAGETLGKQFNYFSGTDDERLQDLQQMLDDPEVDAILCARGGYGLSRIIDRIDFSRFVERPKWLIGFSDITVLHAHVYRRFGIASLHAPMAAAFNNNESENQYVQSLRSSLAGIKEDYQGNSHPLNRVGSAKGELVGGNLSLLAHLIGTPSEIKTKGRILFLEDVGEYIYNVDRMFYQLKRSGKLDKLAALIIGGFTDMKDTTVPFGMRVYDLISHVVKEYDYPVVFGFPVSHSRENYALKIGATYKLKVSKEKIRLKQK